MYRQCTLDRLSRDIRRIAGNCQGETLVHLYTVIGVVLRERILSRDNRARIGQGHRAGNKQSPFIDRSVRKHESNHDIRIVRDTVFVEDCQISGACLLFSAGENCIEIELIETEASPEKRRRRRWTRYRRRRGW